MQNQSKKRIVYQEYVDEDLPIVAFSHRVQRDNPRYTHFHPELELGVCESGVGSFFIGRAIRSFSAGACVVVFPGQRHIAHSATEEDSLWTFVEINVERLISDLPACQVLWQRLSQQVDTVPNLFWDWGEPDICRLIRLFVAALTRPEPWDRDYLRALFWALLTRLEALCGTYTWLDPTAEGRTILIWPAVEYITLHYGDEVRCERLNELCACSPATFRRTFQAVMGTTPHQYLARVRLKAAANLLRVGQTPVGEVALAVGYQDLSSFNRAFKKRFGCSPSVYRRQETK